MGDDFIINGDVLEAYVGNPDITDLFIPDGIRIINSRIFQEKMKNPLSIHLPESVERIHKEAFRNCNCKHFNFPKGSKLKCIEECAIEGELVEEMILPEGMEEFNSVSNKLCIKFLKVPKSLHKLQADAYIMAIPEENSLQDFSFKNTLFIMYSGKLDLEARYKFRNAHYVYENIDLDSISIVNDSKSGISYIRTSRGVIITDIDNNIANLTDLPKTINGEEVLSVNIFYPFSRKWTVDPSPKYRKLLNGNDNEEVAKEKLGNLYSKVKYFVTKVENKLDQLYTLERRIIVPERI